MKKTSKESTYKPLVSVIVPVYNCEQYVKECIDSLLRQSYSDIEVIVVNDGSTDDSLKICRKYEELDSRIKVFDQENQGVSSARNKGIQMARGKFLSFVDADDYVDRDFIESLVAIMPDAGIGICGYKRAEEDKIKHEYIICKELNVASLYRNIFAKSDILSGCCNKLFSADIIHKHHLTFDNKLYVGEDMVFLAEYLKCVQNNFKYLAKSTYTYRKNKKSTLQRTYFNQEFDAKKATCLDAVEKLNVLYDNPEPYIKKCFSYRIVRSSLWLLFQMIFSNKYEKKYADRIKNNVRKNLKIYLKYREGSRLEHIMTYLTYISPKCVFVMGKVVLKAFPNYAEKYLN